MPGITISNNNSNTGSNICKTDGIGSSSTTSFSGIQTCPSMLGELMMFPGGIYRGKKHTQ